MLAEFVTAANHHPMGTTRNQSPLQIWTQGFYKSPNKGNFHEIDPQFNLYSTDWDGSVPEFHTNKNVVIPELNVPENLECIMSLFNPLHDDGNHGISYNKILRELTLR